MLVAAQKTVLPWGIESRRLPKLPRGIALDELPLTTRARRCLKAAGLSNGWDLQRQTVGRLLKIPGFGLNSLVSLLSALEPFMGEPQTRLRDNRDTARALVREAKQLLTTPYLESLCRDDLRLGYLLATIGSKIGNAHRLAERLISGAYIPLNPEMAARQLRKFRERVQDFSRLKLEEELMSLVVAAVGHRKEPIVVRRFGWDGLPGGTLESVGNTFGITRERVRQICALASLSGKVPFAPVLDKVFKLLSGQPVESFDRAGQLLISESLTKGPFSPQSLRSAGKLLGREVPAIVQEACEPETTISPEERATRKAIRFEAHIAVLKKGVATIAEVAAWTARKSPLSPDLEKTAAVVRNLPGFRSFDDDEGWFSLMPLRNNMLSYRIRKILSVAGEIEASQIGPVIPKGSRFGYSVPPEQVLLGFCRLLPWCRVREKTIIADPPLYREDVLTSAEQVVFRVLKEHGPVVPRQKLKNACLGFGIKNPTFEKTLRRSPIITKYAPGFYGLRGTHLPEGEVELIRPLGRLFVRTLSSEEETHLEAGLQTDKPHRVWPCRILLASARGESVAQIAENVGRAESTVRREIRDFNARGLACLSKERVRGQPSRHRIWLVQSLAADQQQGLAAGLQSHEPFVRRRSEILLAKAQGETVREIADRLDCGDETVYRALRDFDAHGLECLGTISTTDRAIVGRGARAQRVSVRSLTAEEGDQLEAGSRSQDAFKRRRCEILLSSFRGESAGQIARRLSIGTDTAYRAIRAFNTRGVDCITEARAAVDSTALVALLRENPRDLATG